MMNTESVLLNSDQGAIMASLDPGLEVPVASSNVSAIGNSEGGGYRIGNNSTLQKSLPDVLSSSELQSLNLLADHENNRLSFLMLDAQDQLTTNSLEEFCSKLGAGDSSLPAKVISIVGNAGDGKSYGLNQIFFPDLVLEGQEVFATSNSSGDSCTSGIWAAFEPHMQTLVLDTEGMLGMSAKDYANGITANENRRTRQLLKILAISDIVIYKTRAERIHTDVLYFLGDASKAYNEHFSSELRKIGNSELLGPTVILFQETRYTNILPPADDHSINQSPEALIRERLLSLNQDISAFSKVKYFGIQKERLNGIEEEKEYFSKLREVIRKELSDTTIRSPRSIKLIYQTLSALNTKFSGEVSPTSHRSFPDEYFTCRMKCSACQQKCHQQLNHDGFHHAPVSCIYNKSLNNKQYYCKRCYQNGRRNLVVHKASSSEESTWMGLATYAWSGSVLECSICGVIYRSRQQWSIFGNDSPEGANVVHTEISHIWPGVRTLQGTHNAARRVLDGVGTLGSTVSTLSSAPSKSVGGWLADRIAPNYWRPNSDITNCRLCDRRLDVTDQKIHHCRACGEGFCGDCSDYKRPVPERGWGADEPVRVCRDCYGPLATKAMRSKSSGNLSQTPNMNGNPSNQHVNSEKQNEVQVRRYGEKMLGTLNSLATVVLDPVTTVLKDSARPAYWVPDEDCFDCCVCKKPFDTQQSSSSNSLSNSCASPGSSTSTSKIKLHHCRQCGRGVCDDCSKARKQVPLRGWDEPVRVCDLCKNMELQLAVNS